MVSFLATVTKYLARSKREKGLVWSHGWRRDLYHGRLALAAGHSSSKHAGAGGWARRWRKETADTL